MQSEKATIHNRILILDLISAFRGSKSVTVLLSQNIIFPFQGLLGSFAPCVLFGGNAERLGSGPGSFTHNCFTYAGLYLLGKCLFGLNCLAPWISYPSRAAIRRRFNLEGNYETLARSVGCHRVLQGDEERHEQLESICDLATHVFCHPCALCQEARELRRRLHHPGFAAQPVMVMMPPMEQTMGHGAA